MTIARRLTTAAGAPVVTAALAGAASAATPIVLEKNNEVVGDVAPSTACQGYGYAFLTDA